MISTQMSVKSPLSEILVKVYGLFLRWSAKSKSDFLANDKSYQNLKLYWNSKMI